jgi:heptaprenyl diphosphate synthase
MKQNVAWMGLMVALALIFSYVEVLLPLPIPVPGIKLGLANLVIVLVLYLKGTKEAFLLSMVRIILAGFLFGNLSMILYSLAGGMLSLVVMALFIRMNFFGIVGVSILGAIAHNLGQLLLAMYLLETKQIAYYVPVLLVAGLICGSLIGMFVARLIERVRFLFE